jgi:hypothetical protein
MTVFYASPHLLITDRVFAVLSPQLMRLPIETVDQAYVVIVRTWWPPLRTTYELRNTYQASDVCLFRTADRRAFGQVRRALVRALEDARYRRDASWLRMAARESGRAPARRPR